MARRYSTRSLFWQLPNALLARYFAESSLSGDLSFPALKATKAEAPVEAGLAVREHQRKPMDAGLQGMMLEVRHALRGHGGIGGKPPISHLGLSGDNMLRLHS